MYFKKNFIVIKEKKNEKRIDIKFNNEKFQSPVVKIFFTPNIETAPKAGTESKKEILAASYLVKLRNLPAVIVIPDLLTPGTNDNIWNRPIIIALLTLK